MAKNSSGGLVQGKSPVIERDTRESFTPTAEGQVKIEVPEPTEPMDNWGKFRQRLMSLRGQMVTLTIMVGRDGEPICWSTLDQKRIENLPAAPVA